MLKNIIISCIFLLVVHTCNAQWGYSNEQMEVWDLVDEVQMNFYEFIGVSPDESSSAIRRAYRKLSLEMHPDKNKTEGAEENFRILVAVNEVLKNKEKRAIYDDVLIDGIPRAYSYVPKQIRKMGLLEVSAIMTLILTVGHGLFMWGVYLEKIVLEEYKLESKRKKSLKKKNVDQDVNVAVNIQTPKLIDILPIAICRGIYYLVKIAPQIYHEKKEVARLEKERKDAEEKEMAEALIREEELKQKREQQKLEKKARNRQKQEEQMNMVTMESPSDLKPFFEEPTLSYDDLDSFYDEELVPKKPKSSKWSVDEDARLVKLMTKYPRGTVDRWEVIAEEMDRYKNDVISRAKKAEKLVGMVKANQSVVLKNSDKNLIPQNMDTSVRYETNDDQQEEINNEKSTTEDSGSNWSQDEQVLLELALKQYPKKLDNDDYDRWELIASMIPNKSKKDCVMRYKFIAKQLKKKQVKS